MISTRGRFLLAGLLSTLAVALLYWAAVRTEPGQQLDQLIFDSRTTEPLAVREDAAALLNRVNYHTLPMLAGGVTLLALSFAGWRAALRVGVAIAGAVFSSELLKHLLPRPGLLDIDLYHQTHNSFPSGHATIAMALGLALVVAVPTRLRPAAALSAALLAATFGAATMIGGWHRPSDTVAGYLIAFAWACLLAPALVRRNAADESASRTAVAPWMASLYRWSGVALLVAGLGLILLMLFEVNRGDSSLIMHAELLTAVALIVISALYLLWWFTRQADTDNSRLPD